MAIVPAVSMPMPFGARVVDPLASLRADQNQMRSIQEYLDSVVEGLEMAQGTPEKALMRELLSQGLRPALDLVGETALQRFLEALSLNIHKFPLQEQQSLASIFPVEISSEYGNLQSFVQNSIDDEAVSGPLGLAAPPPVALRSVVALENHPEPKRAVATARVLLEEVRHALRKMPSKPIDVVAAGELLERLVDDDEFAGALNDADKDAIGGFLGDLRLNLFKFPDAAQRELLEAFPQLRADVARLVDSMTSEVTRWLGEERAGSVARKGIIFGPLLGKLLALFQAILSAPFLASFKHLGPADKPTKEGFLLRVALCAKLCSEKPIGDTEKEKDIAEGVRKLRRQFFYVEGYGELMEDWLQGRLRQYNDDFLQRVSAALSTKFPSILEWLQRTFQPGRWLFLSDAKLEGDLFSLFLDSTFPRHVILNDTIRQMLQKFTAAGCGDFHIYGNIARAPPQLLHMPFVGNDPVESAMLILLQRYPQFPVLKRIRPGLFYFGNLQVEFALRGSVLFARPTQSGVEEMTADVFFDLAGPTEFPAAASLAVEACLRTHSPPTTIIENFMDLAGTRCRDMQGRPANAVCVAAAPASVDLTGGVVSIDDDGIEELKVAQRAAPPVFSAAGPVRSIVGGQERYDPYGAPPTLPLTSVGYALAPRLGLEDDEI